MSVDDVVATPGFPDTWLPTDVQVTPWRVVLSEWSKFWSLQSSRIAVVATAVGMVGLGVLVSAITASRWDELPQMARDHFDPTLTSLNGFELAQLVVGVLGVLMVSGEFGTGMIRSTLTAVPTRLPVVLAKAGVCAAVMFVVGEVASFTAFLAGQALFASRHIEADLSEPGVLRAVVGTGLYLMVVGLLGVAIGWILRSTAGGVATLFGLLLVLPVLGRVLPDSVARHVVPYLPSNAGGAVTLVAPRPDLLAPWTGFAVFCLYAVAGFAIAAAVVRRRDV